MKAELARLDGWPTQEGAVGDADEMHEALRVIDPGTGATVAELVDDGKQLLSSAWSPVAGDDRLAVVHERRGIPQPALWDPVTGGMATARNARRSGGNVILFPVHTLPSHTMAIPLGPALMIRPQH